MGCSGLSWTDVALALARRLRSLLALANRPLSQQLRAKAGGAALLLPPHRPRNVQVAPLHLQTAGWGSGGGRVRSGGWAAAPISAAAPGDQASRSLHPSNANLPPHTPAELALNRKSTTDTM